MECGCLQEHTLYDRCSETVVSTTPKSSSVASLEKVSCAWRQQGLILQSTCLETGLQLAGREHAPRALMHVLVTVRLCGHSNDIHRYVGTHAHM